MWFFSNSLTLYLKFPIPSTICLFLPSRNSLWVHMSPATWYWGWDVGSGKPKEKPRWKCVTKTSCLESLPWNYQNNRTVGKGQYRISAAEVIHFLWDYIDQKYPSLYHLSPHSQTVLSAEYQRFQQGEIGLEKKCHLLSKQSQAELPLNTSNDEIIWSCERPQRPMPLEVWARFLS